MPLCYDGNYQNTNQVSHSAETMLSKLKLVPAVIQTLNYTDINYPIFVTLPGGKWVK
jgi:hypothetical protein